MPKKPVPTKPRPQGSMVTYYTITPAAWNLLRSFAFQPQNGQPLAFEDCLALEARLHHYDEKARFLIALAAEAWRQTYPNVPTAIEFSP